jgi:hypothetical protein
MNRRGLGSPAVHDKLNSGKATRSPRLAQGTCLRDLPRRPTRVTSHLRRSLQPWRATRDCTRDTAAVSQPHPLLNRSRLPIHTGDGICQSPPRLRLRLRLRLRRFRRRREGCVLTHVFRRLPDTTRRPGLWISRPRHALFCRIAPRIRVWLDLTWGAVLLYLDQVNARGVLRAARWCHLHQ